MTRPDLCVVVQKYAQREANGELCRTGVRYPAPPESAPEPVKPRNDIWELLFPDGSVVEVVPAAKFVELQGELTRISVEMIAALDAANEKLAEAEQQLDHRTLVPDPTPPATVARTTGPESERLGRPHRSANTDSVLHKREDWHEDDGPVLWWFFPLREPPYVGGETDDDFPDYVTHWTRIIGPDAPPTPPVFERAWIAIGPDGSVHGAVATEDECGPHNAWFEVVPAAKLAAAEAQCDALREALRSIGASHHTATGSDLARIARAALDGVAK